MKSCSVWTPVHWPHEWIWLWESHLLLRQDVTLGTKTGFLADVMSSLQGPCGDLEACPGASFLCVWHSWGIFRGWTVAFKHWSAVWESQGQMGWDLIISMLPKFPPEDTILCIGKPQYFQSSQINRDFTKSSLIHIFFLLVFFCDKKVHISHSGPTIPFVKLG